MPNFAILGIHHADRSRAPRSTASCIAASPTGSEVRYRQSPDEERMQHDDERILLRFFRQLGCRPPEDDPAGARIEPALRRHVPDPARRRRSAHVRPLEPACARRARVCVADGSGVPVALARRALTFNIMANANRVGTMLASVSVRRDGRHMRQGERAAWRARAPPAGPRASQPPPRHHPPRCGLALRPSQPAAAARSPPHCRMVQPSWQHSYRRP